MRTVINGGREQKTEPALDGGGKEKRKGWMMGQRER